MGEPEQMEILELGPGRGLFGQDVLDWSEKKFPDFYRALHYTLEERSPSLRERLRSQFRNRMESGKVHLIGETNSGVSLMPQTDAVKGSAQVQRDSSNLNVGDTSRLTARRKPQRLKPSSPQHSAARLEAEPFQSSEQEGSDCSSGGRGPDSSSEGKNPDSRPEREGHAFRREREGQGFSHAASSEKFRTLAPEVPLIVFANEFFDALPVEVLSEKGSLRIGVRDGNFVEEWTQPSAAELEFLDRYSVHPEGSTRTEATLTSQKQMAGYAAAIQKGFFVVIDYGYAREEQLAGRHLGTVMAYRQHSASPNPYEAPGEQDITAHVNFTALAAAAEQNGMHAHKLLTQSQFLLGIGEANQFADAFEDCRLPQERAKVALQLKHLVTPAGMGETFHVLVASKGVDEKTAEGLSGMSFGKR